MTRIQQMTADFLRITIRVIRVQLISFTLDSTVPNLFVEVGLPIAH